MKTTYINLTLITLILFGCSVRETTNLNWQPKYPPYLTQSIHRIKEYYPKYKYKGIDGYRNIDQYTNDELSKALPDQLTILLEDSKYNRITVNKLTEHGYIVHELCEDLLLVKFKPGIDNIGYIASTPIPGMTTPLYRFWSPTQGHLFTASKTEYDNLIKTGSGWYLEFIVGYTCT